MTFQVGFLFEPIYHTLLFFLPEEPKPKTNFHQPKLVKHVGKKQIYHRKTQRSTYTK